MIIMMMTTTRAMIVMVVMRWLMAGHDSWKIMLVRLRGVFVSMMALKFVQLAKFFDHIQTLLDSR